MIELNFDGIRTKEGRWMDRTPSVFGPKRKYARKTLQEHTNHNSFPYII